MKSKEEIYLISYSIGRLGDIIASNVPASNNNFFDIYRFSNAELEHTRENLKDMSCRAFISLTKSGNYALFLRFPSSSVAMLVCMLGEDDAVELIRYNDNIRISERVMARSVGDAVYRKDSKVRYLFDNCAALAGRYMNTEADLGLLSEIYNVDVDISYSDGELMPLGGEAVLSEDMLCMFLHAVMMSASVCGTSKVGFNIIGKGDLYMISSVIKAEDNSNVLKTLEMLMYISDMLGTEFMYTCDGEIRLLLCPYFADSGMVGLKTDMRLLFNINK